MVRPRRIERSSPLIDDALFRRFSEALDQVIWFIRENAETFSFVSSSVERIFGISPAELYASPGVWLDTIFSEDRERVESAFYGWLHREVPEYVVEYRIRRRTDGAIRWIFARGSLMPGSEDRSLRMFGGIAEDITQRKQLEQERGELLHRLEHALQFRDEFISLASHELRTPLVPLKLSLQTINRLIQMEKQPLPGLLGRPEFHRLLSTAMEQVLRMEVLTNNLLDASSLQAGRLEIHREKMNLSDLLNGIIAAHRHWVESSGSSLRVRIQANVVGEFDGMRIDQIIVNLISNALKYAPGSLIEIELEQLDGTARLVVRDHGPGLPAELMPRLFERFSRSEKSRGKHGIGLGLYLSRQIAEAHGGKISARQAEGGGAEFELIVPVREREEHPSAELKAG